MTRLLVVGEALEPARDAAELSWWQQSLLSLGVLAPEEGLEPVDLARIAGPGRAIVIVREQLDHLNALYCRAVLRLDTFADFDSFAQEAIDSGRHDLLQQLGPLLDAADSELVAVPYSRTGQRAVAPGPLLVAAMRMLHKRLHRVGSVRPVERQLMAQAAAQLQDRAEQHEWDRVPFWGWSEAGAAQAADRFRAGNDDFAHRVWGTDWPDPPVPRDQTRVDLAGCAPATVSDVLAAIQEAVDGARKGSSGDDSEQE